jgi:hypothetical protein
MIRIGYKAGRIFFSTIRPGLVLNVAHTGDAVNIKC